MKQNCIRFTSSFEALASLCHTNKGNLYLKNITGFLWNDTNIFFKAFPSKLQMKIFINGICGGFSACFPFNKSTWNYYIISHLFHIPIHFSPRNAFKRFGNWLIALRISKPLF